MLLLIGLPLEEGGMGSTRQRGSLVVVSPPRLHAEQYSEAHLLPPFPSDTTSCHRERKAAHKKNAITGF